LYGENGEEIAMTEKEKIAKLKFKVDPDAFHWAENSEEGLVSLIKKYLLDDAQKMWLFNNDLDIADILNGRYAMSLAGDVTTILFDPWNDKMGYRSFGF
jgi:hypothetical protein